MGELRDSMASSQSDAGFSDLKKDRAVSLIWQSPLILKKQRLSGDSQRAPYNLGIK
jgi:hypothetical protein